VSQFIPDYFGGQLQRSLMGTVQPQQQPQYQPPAIAQPSSASSASQQSGPLGSCAGVFSCIFNSGNSAQQPQAAGSFGQAGPLGSCAGVFSCVFNSGNAAPQPQALGSPQDLTAQVRQEAQSINLGASGALGQFCAYWPNAKTALQLILTVVPNVMVKTAVTLAISVGDGLC